MQGRRHEIYPIPFKDGQVREPVLQDYVVPICSYEERRGLGWITNFYGTAFFITSDGVYLTARHVVEQCLMSGAKQIGLVIKDRQDAKVSKLVPLGITEHAPGPWDVSIGKSTPPSANWFCWPSKTKIEGWQDVASLGYPESALNVTVERFDLNMRMMKGYVLRPLRPEDQLQPGRHPPSFELNFAIPQGMSGSPLFTFDVAKKQMVIGVCVTSHTAEIVEHSFEEIEEGGAVYREKRLKAEQYGIAHSLLPLGDWRPQLLGGKSLKEALISE